MDFQDLSEMERQAHILNFPHLVTMEVIYHMPDHPDILQSFLWQNEDIVPDYPKAKTFVEHWIENIEAKINRILLGHKQDTLPPEYLFADYEFNLKTDLSSDNIAFFQPMH